MKKKEISLEHISDSYTDHCVCTGCSPIPVIDFQRNPLKHGECGYRSGQSYGGEP